MIHVGAGGDHEPHRATCRHCLLRDRLPATCPAWQSVLRRAPSLPQRLAGAPQDGDREGRRRLRPLRLTRPALCAPPAPARVRRTAPASARRARDALPQLPHVRAPGLRRGRDVDVDARGLMRRETRSCSGSRFAQAPDDPLCLPLHTCQATAENTSEPAARNAFRLQPSREWGRDGALLRDVRAAVRRDEPAEPARLLAELPGGGPPAKARGAAGHARRSRPARGRG
jgi:hypothetical protein